MTKFFRLILVRPFERFFKLLGLQVKTPKQKTSRRFRPATYPPAPAQDVDEFRQFLDLLRSEGVRSYLEIGALYGGCFNAVMRSLPPGSVGIAIDLPGASWGLSDTERWLRRVISDLNEDGYRTELLIGSSRDEAIVEAARQRAPFDAALIDGDHSYDGTRADWINYEKMARIVAFHDIAGDNVVNKHTLQPVEVPRVWRELKATAKGTIYEFVTDPKGFGIGVVVR